MNVYRLTNKDDEIEATVVEFDNGKVVTSWEVEGLPKSVAVWDSLDDAFEIHVNQGRRNLVPVAQIV